MGTTRDDGSQQTMWVATADLPQGGGHPFYERLNQILSAAGWPRVQQEQERGYGSRLFVSFTAVDRLRKVHPLAPRLGAPGVAVVGPRAAWPHRAGTEFGRHRLFPGPEWIHEREGSKTSTGAGKDARFYRSRH